MLSCDLNYADDGEIFQVKKSSQSRRLIKQLKAEKKAAKKNGSGTLTLPNPPTPPSLSKRNDDYNEEGRQQNANSVDPTLNIRFKF